LNYGKRQINCDLLVIFDADFIPNPDFLLRTVPMFQDERVGAVHTRWNHLNDSDSPLTMLQAAVLDTLFCFENEIRQSMGESTIYLGTSGVWRKRTIDELGGWREAPFTDDGIDLSYRAQIADWFVGVVGEPLASSELPGTDLAYKSQQRRWARAALRLFLDYWRYAFTVQRRIRSILMELSLPHLVLSMPCLLLVTLLTGLYIGLGFSRSTSWLTAQIGLAAIIAVFPPAQEVILSQKLLYADWKKRCLLALRAFPLAIGLSLSILAGFWDTIGHSDIESLCCMDRQPPAA
jgi:cellulose synthase/poly-beta-1,6-N-acetylglucosamine synthase-like glycosyltransferase